MGSSLRAHILTRALMTIPMVFVLVTVVFLILRVMPGDPALAILRETASLEQLRNLRHSLGLDKPVLFNLRGSKATFKQASNLYRDPDENSPVLRLIEPGEELRITGWPGEEGWLLLGATEHMVGWVQVDNLRRGLWGSLTSTARTATETEVFGVRLRATTNAWLARFGVSLLPFVPSGLADGDTIAARWLGEIRVGADVEYRNIASPGEGVQIASIGYFGMDAPVLPDAWNPLSRWMRLFVVGGVDTQGGWGIGVGLFGHGPLEFMGCTPSYSSRPRAPALGDRTDIWSATCGVQVPF